MVRVIIVGAQEPPKVVKEPVPLTDIQYLPVAARFMVTVDYLVSVFQYGQMLRL